ncbi:hypothetical protein MA16_Dca027868 [Dendrobium catenatum]|uniref:Uncharacterized protein n=1 Tax=Dendrobium catenatum TaxID=906689 RepID=A0A2I0VHG2_9ASPA|nr:hypothetical protein MA16_Dca027868 [Dendrobium catenatum]
MPLVTSYEGGDANKCIFNIITSPIASPNLVDDDAGVHSCGCHSSCLMGVVVSIGIMDVVDSTIVGYPNSNVPLLEYNLSNEPFISVSISLISNEVLKARGDRDDLDGPDDDFQATYNLNINRIVEKAFAMGGSLFLVHIACGIVADCFERLAWVAAFV